MPTEVRSNRTSQIIAWITAVLFTLGFFLHPIGQWTQPILGAWFVGTQRPLRGFLWILAFGFFPGLLTHWRPNSLQQALHSLAGLLVLAVAGVVPLTVHRLLSPRLPGLLATLPFPLAAALMMLLLSTRLSVDLHDHFGLAPFMPLWVAALLVWLWKQESGATTWVATATLVAVGGSSLLVHLRAIPQFELAASGEAIAWACGCGLAALVALAVFRQDRPRNWANCPEAIATLKSPWTGAPFHVEGEPQHQLLVSGAGERFPINHGIPCFLRQDDLTGNNGKYNHLYESIGGFYDDTQRFFGAFRGIALDSYFRNYMDLLDVKPGDAVLETSVGTGLNFKFLPRGVKLSGLDLSQEMLANCQRNLRRWRLDADLFLGNAESLPFADASFEVVYTAGAINFFNDRSKAIREMIRVAKPGGMLMVEDETEKYVRNTYEKIPGTREFFKDRKQPVTVPIDLIPPEMEDIKLYMLKDDKFYAITFRKPGAVHTDKIDA